MFYSFSDGARFLRSNLDKILYLISVILQKPILLPILMPNRFRSRIAEKHLKTQSVTFMNNNMVDELGIMNLVKENRPRPVGEIKRVQPTNFLLAVQETNFLLSFSLSGFIAVSTACSLLIDD